MPGRLFLTHEPEALEQALGVAWASGVALPRVEIAPGEAVAVLVAEGAGRALRDMRWSMIMSGRRNARGRPVMETIVNARSETVLDKTAFAGVARGAIPVSGWYEWTGETRKKTRWRLARADGAPLAVAAIWDVWRGPGGVEVAQCAAVTCAPNADVDPYHHRMPVLLDADALALWLGGDEAAARAALRVPEAGLIAVDAAADVQARVGH